MTKSKASAPAVAPNYPNAVIDFDTVHANDAKGKTGAALFDGALVETFDPAPTAPTQPEPPQEPAA